MLSRIDNAKAFPWARRTLLNEAIHGCHPTLLRRLAAHAWRGPSTPAFWLWRLRTVSGSDRPRLRGVTLGGALPPRGERGFALVAVIWIATLLAVVAFIFTTSVRSYISSAEADLATAGAEALAEAGVNLAVLDLVTSAGIDGRRRFPVDGSSVVCRLGDGDLLTLSVRDEAGKADLNVASDGLLRALFMGLGLSRPDADARVDAIGDFKDSDSDKRLNGAETDEYAAAGMIAGPKNAAFDAVEELAGIPGFDGELVRKLRPFLTVHSGQDGIDPGSVSAELAAALRRGYEDGQDALPSLLDGSSPLPPPFVSASTQRVFGIQSEVRTARGARFVREAVVSLVEGVSSARTAPGGRSNASAKELPYRIWRWRRGESFAVEPPAGTIEAPPC